MAFGCGSGGQSQVKPSPESELAYEASGHWEDAWGVETMDLDLESSQATVMLFSDSKDDTLIGTGDWRVEDTEIVVHFGARDSGVIHRYTLLKGDTFMTLAPSPGDGTALLRECYFQPIPPEEPDYDDEPPKSYPY